MRRLSIGLLLLVLEGCVWTTDLSGSKPYAAMIGACYELEQSMDIFENGCWSIGDLILSDAAGHSCFKSPPRRRVDRGHRFSIEKIYLKQAGTYGACPQAAINLQDVFFGGREINIPLCGDMREISWLEDPVAWQKGDPIAFKPGYVRTISCNEG